MSDIIAKKRLSVRTDDVLASALMLFCKSEDLHPSQVMRRALRAFIPKEFFDSKPAAKKQQTKASKRKVEVVELRKAA